MLPEIEQLLIIQDRDQKITKLNSDVERLPLEEPWLRIVVQLQFQASF